MKKQIIAGVCATVFLSCGGLSVSAEESVNFDEMYLNLEETVRNSPSSSFPMPEAPAERRQGAVEPKDWTIMVFINGKNDLQDYAVKDLNEMEMVGSTSEMNVVVEAGRIDPPPAPPFWFPYYPGGYSPGGPHPPPYMSRSAASLDSSGTGTASQPSPEAEGSTASYSAHYESWVGVRRYLILKDTDTQKVTSPILEEFESADMGDWKHLVSFAQWAKSRFPARRYMLIIWNHGDGWKRPAIDINILSKGISYDDETGNHITIAELGEALKQIGGVDVYASDACLMQMAEVAYEIRNYAKVIIGSEETEPGDGYAYDLFLGALASRSNPSPGTIGQLTVQAYMDHYGGKKSETTQSALRASAMPHLRVILDQWAQLAMEAGDPALFKQARDSALSFSDSNSKDLVNFLEIATAGTKSAELKNKGIEVMNFVCDELLIANGSWGDGYEKAYGLAVYLPGYSFNEKYRELAWARYGKWDEFVQWLLKKSESSATDDAGVAESTVSAD